MAKKKANRLALGKVAASNEVGVMLTGVTGALGAVCLSRLDRSIITRAKKAKGPDSQEAAWLRVEVVANRYLPQFCVLTQEDDRVEVEPDWDTIKALMQPSGDQGPVIVSGCYFSDRPGPGWAIVRSAIVGKTRLFRRSRVGKTGYRWMIEWEVDDVKLPEEQPESAE